ncbi:MAG TPA: radical SAM protein [Nannocystaceae bacterium]|nr:radical SAM protein [Nannocystaceae bacterium]
MEERAREETVGFGVARQHEEAAHQRRNWVRLTFDCNDRCVFCLDSDAHDGRMRAREEVKAQILDGRAKGAERLILSGGEPTIHPDFVDFVRLGRAAGYPRIQTVTNGRMFAYGDFLRRSLDAGLDEITFSIHGPDAKIHDALVGVPGAYEQEIAGLQHALADGRPIVNIDVCVNRANVKHLATMLRKYIAMGVKEFDLLQVIPFGRAYREGREILLYDLEQARPHLLEAFAFARVPGIHLWLNRFPVEHLEGFEDLIQDPYKIGDEVRGRRQEFARLLADGIPLPCREPERCKHCYVERLCDHLDEVRGTVAAGVFETVRIDTAWEAEQPPAYGGDPASDKRIADVPASTRRRLPVLGAATERSPRDLSQYVADSGARTAWVRAPDLRAALAAIARLPTLGQLELELDDCTDAIAALTASGDIAGRRVIGWIARDPATAEALLPACEAHGIELVVRLDRAAAAWLLARASLPSCIALRHDGVERASEEHEHGLALAPFFAELRARFGRVPPTIGVPACLSGEPPRPRPPTFDTTMATDDGALEIHRYARRFVLDHYRVKSLRCRPCRESATCPGVPVNYVRAHGFAELRPLAPDRSW